MTRKPSDNPYAIRLDVASGSVIVLCASCPWWQAFVFKVSDGWTSGAKHITSVHEGAGALADKARDMAYTNAAYHRGRGR